MYILPGIYGTHIFSGSMINHSLNSIGSSGFLALAVGENIKWARLFFQLLDHSGFLWVDISFGNWDQAGCGCYVLRTISSLVWLPLGVVFIQSTRSAVISNPVESVPDRSTFPLLAKSLRIADESKGKYSK